MTIKRIKVENVKGAKCIDIQEDILPNKVTLMVAPNGFGKTSISTALDSLNRNGLKLDKKHYHNGDANLPARLTLTLEPKAQPASEFVADSSGNALATLLDVHVINSRTYAKGIRIKIQGNTIVSASLAMDAIELGSTVAKTDFKYNVTDSRNAFGPNGKVLPNLKDDLACGLLISGLLDHMGVLAKSAQVGVGKALTQVTASINEVAGSRDVVMAWIRNNALGQLDAIEPVHLVADLMAASRPAGRDRVELLVAALSLCLLQKADPKTFKAACEYCLYAIEREGYDALIASFDTTGKSVRTAEKNGKLVIDFPDPGRVSNGQRDALSFAAQLQRIRGRLGKRDVLLVIDEIFDYLDDANLVAAQYYIAAFIEHCKKQGGRIYTLIFTHLNPAAFRNFGISDQRVLYLDKSAATLNEHFRKILLAREDPAIQDKIAKHFLHYSPNAVDLEAEFKALKLHVDWCKSDVFAKFPEREWKKYIAGQEKFDPLAVCCYVRIELERKLYVQLNDATEREAFTNVHRTTKKFDYARSKDVTVPEVFYLLAIIYNAGLHIRENTDETSPVVASLSNRVIRNMLETAMRE